MTPAELNNPLLQMLHEKPTLLIVDDHAGSIQTLYEIFKDEYEVCFATSGAQALERCKERQPQLILLDVMMPDMDGFEVCHRLKSEPLTEAIPIIFVTGTDDPYQEARGLDAGAADFITKPFHARVVMARVRTQLTLKRQTDLLRSLVLMDGLTGVANRRHFDATLENEWRRCARTGSPLALILLDVDFFKDYNDFYGHPAGDVCLQRVAHQLSAILERPGDMAARYGGEEFVCLLPDTPMEGALAVATEMESAVRALAIPHARSQVTNLVTVSVGVAVTVPKAAEDPGELVFCADLQMYKAKNAGRAQVKSQQL
ncbi:diguanylate cyclase [Uliginosibacterium sp. H3]|uniref:diguanylate cyclase n=1 Tax=Uliginosibacterium silvisoli TaxID=3114758 RepID=A0ABU6JZF7_9RHOO|nr:diguanylate cyclase [Uliginosibacterium sp. H3]